MRIWLALILGTTLILAACGQNAPARNNKNINPPELTQQQLNELREQGVHVMTAWPEGDTLYLNVLEPSQRAVAKIYELTGENVVIIKEEARFFIRGEITEINDSEDRRTLLIENGDVDSEYDKAYISVNEYTKILVPRERHSQEVAEALCQQALETGQLVEIAIVGPVAESYPPQAGAGIVKIID
ncbi:MAG: hypothetical protein FH749_06380 [Firmicutes bacterium]|nr:hypothetical protein [Bacillota bacterium]